METFPRPLVDSVWLQANIAAVDIVDVRWSIEVGPMRSAFELERIEGAQFFDLDRDLSGPAGSAGRHPLPDSDAFVDRLRERGIGGRPIVCYDESSGAKAARLWWMLDTLGYRASVLDGGLYGWSGPVSSAPTNTPIPPQLPGANIGSWPKTVSASDMERRDAIDAVLDARSAERFEGVPNTIDPRFGHIPGSRSRPWSANLGEDGTMLPADELRTGFDTAGISASTRWISSCGSGVTACHNLLAARVAGLSDGRLYPGSWSEWAADPRRPVDTARSSS